MENFTYEERTHIDSVKSVVLIYFSASRKQYYYYNDLYDLQCGDIVFVSGKMEDEPGEVVSVSLKFKIHLSDYEKVVKKVSFEMHGTFTKVLNYRVSLNKAGVTPESFRNRFIAAADGDNDDIVCGEGYETRLDELEAYDELREVIFERAVNYCKEGRVNYLSVSDGCVTAFVNGCEWYEISFRLENGTAADIYCDCPYPGFCKHEAAVIMILRELLSQPAIKDVRDFTAIDENTFLSLLSEQKSITL